MAYDVTAVQSGSWHETSTWDTGIVPTAGQTVDIATYTVTIQSGTETNDVGDVTGGDGCVLYVKGQLNLDGRLLFNTADTDQTLQMDGGGIIELVCSSNGQTDRYIHLAYAGTVFYVNASDPIGNPAIIRSRSASLRAYTLLETGIVKIVDVDGLHIYNGYIYGWLFGGIFDETGSYSNVKNVIINNITVTGTDGTAMAVVGGSHSVVSNEFRNICIYDCDAGLNLAYEIIAHNIVFGRDINGNSYPNSRADIYASYRTFKYENIVYDDLEIRDYGLVDIDIRNKNYIVQDGIFANYPVSTLVPGTHEFIQSTGNAVWSSGTIVVTPDADCNSNKPFTLNDDYSLSFHGTIPANGGDRVKIAATVELNDSQTASTVTLKIDPHNVYNNNTSSTESTSPSTETTLTAQATLPSGSYEANVDWLIEVNDYASGGTVTVKSVTAYINDASAYTLDFDTWTFDEIPSTGLVNIWDVWEFCGVTSVDDTDLVSSIHAACEAWVEQYCNKRLTSTSYILERYDGTGTQKLFLNNYPVTALSGVYTNTQSAINVINSQTGTVSATISNDGTNVTLYRNGSSVTSLALATYTTLSTLATAISAVTGWTANVVTTDYNDYPSNFLMTGYGYNAKSTYATLEIPDDSDDYELDPNTGIITSWHSWSRGTRNVMVSYTAGYTSATCPDDLALAIKILTQHIWQKRNDQSFGVQSYTTGNVGSVFEMDMSGKMSIRVQEVKAILDKYKRRLI